jgi:hypothetical protein
MAPKLVPVPKTDPDAYNPQRRAGLLLQAQAYHLHHALINHMHEIVRLLKVDLKSLKTEADVSAYVHRATALLHTRNRCPEQK